MGAVGTGAIQGSARSTNLMDVETYDPYDCRKDAYAPQRLRWVVCGGDL
jgi:hypothetical protein